MIRGRSSLRGCLGQHHAVVYEAGRISSTLIIIGAVVETVTVAARACATPLPTPNRRVDREVRVSAAANVELRDKLHDFPALANTGTASVAFTESGALPNGVEFIRGGGIPWASCRYICVRRNLPSQPVPS